MVSMWIFSFIYEAKPLVRISPRFLRIKWQIVRFGKRLHSWDIRLRMFVNRRCRPGPRKRQLVDKTYTFWKCVSGTSFSNFQASGMCERIFSISACLQVLYTARLVYTQADEENAARQSSFVDGRPKGITMETFIVRNPLNQRVQMNLVQFFLTPTTSSQMERQRFRYYC